MHVDERARPAVRLCPTRSTAGFLCNFDFDLTLFLQGATIINDKHNLLFEQEN